MEYYLLVLAKFVLGFLIVISHLNFSGKTQLSQMTPVDFIGNFVLGGIIGGVIYNDVIPLYQYIIVLIIGVMLISLLNAVSKRFFIFRSFAIGNPIPIIKDGKFIMENILKRKNKIDILNVASQLHAQGIHSFQNLKYAQIEPGGQITAVCDGADMPSVILIKDGRIRYSELDAIQKDEDWLNEKVASLGVTQISEIFLAEFWHGEMTLVMSDGKVCR
ncbi:DUF421 domain-containing protein [Rahnella sp. PCH160]|uniref:DUF421 domain-containing protein n=1 Tax=Rahnella sp. PCH160 TaxID=3447928 RepID=UPI0039FDADE6